MEPELEHGASCSVKNAHEAKTKSLKQSRKILFVKNEPESDWRQEVDSKVTLHTDFI